MSKIEDFMAFIAKHEENEDLTADMAKKAEESESTKDYITADGIHVSKSCFDSVRIIFCDMPPYMLKVLKWIASLTGLLRISSSPTPKKTSKSL